MMEIKFDNVLGPEIRVGMMQEQEVIRFSLIGQHHLLDKHGKQLKTLAPNIECQVEIINSKPAELGYRLVLAKKFDPEAAEQAKINFRPQFPNLEIITLGFDIISSEGKKFTSLEYWVCTSPFSSLNEAIKVKETSPQGKTFDMLKVRLAGPRGKLKLILPGENILEFDGWFAVKSQEPADSRVILKDVIVGLEYHWRHLEEQKLRGDLEVRIDNGGKLCAINALPLELYLISVNSSEMMAAYPEELLKAQTIAARNTALATMGKHHFADDFHLCADDHCQCYRGSSREVELSRRVTIDTLGEIMTFGNQVCDARYSKICGGIIESFDSVWYGDPIAYMDSGFDGEPDSPDKIIYPADSEQRARALILSLPDVYCNTTGPDVPQYLKYSSQYFRWQVTYSKADLQQLLSRFPEYDVGDIVDLVPLKRGKSGRIEYLKIIGKHREVTMGKQFEIRKALSPTFLYSSCFFPEIKRDEQGGIESVTLYGAGWGHGVGLCQVGATMMAYKKNSYVQILSHYYQKVDIKRLYKQKVTIEDLKETVGRQDFRCGDACYEFFNCYAVAGCSVYLRKIRITAHKTAANRFEFYEDSSEPANLEELNIDCKFLNFFGSKAYPRPAE